MNVNCLNCNKEFDKSLGQINRSPNHFCTRSCAASYNNRAHPKRVKETRKYCTSCSKEIRPQSTYCINCLPKTNWEERTLHGEWGKRSYQKSSRIRAHARQCYRKSAKPKCCMECGYAENFEVCHIRAISSFPLSTKITEVNHINNLIALCPNHHWELDHGKLDIEHLIT